MTDTAAPDTKRLRELANMATSGPWVWDVATYWDDSAHADAWSTDMKGHPLYESLEGPAHEVLGATYSGNIEAYPDDAAYIAAINPAVVLSLLDRIEELERRLEVARKRSLRLEGEWLRDEPVDNQIEDLRRVLSEEEPVHG